MLRTAFPLAYLPNEISKFNTSEFSLRVDLSDTMERYCLFWTFKPSGIAVKTVLRLSTMVSLNFSNYFLWALSFISILVNSYFSFFSYSLKDSYAVYLFAMIVFKLFCSYFERVMSFWRRSPIFWYLCFSLVSLFSSFFKLAASLSCSFIRF
jgi:hypothetical protein